MTKVIETTTAGIENNMVVLYDWQVEVPDNAILLNKRIGYFDIVFSVPDKEGNKWTRLNR